MIKLPGLIDPHVHLRDPGQTDKEDFLTSSSAALAGGFTKIIDMPNNLSPIVTHDRLGEKIKNAKEKIVCDVGFYFGSMGGNFEEFEKIQNLVLGLKIYLNQTTGNFIVNENVFRNICSAWKINKPILVHAEEDILESILHIAEETNQKVHVCHVSSKTELEIVINAKNKGQNVTCGVTPHHLYLNADDEIRLGAFGKMKPSLKSKKDVEFLWENLKYIDVIESDHAPHTLEEKHSTNPPFGVPGLETTLPLLLTSMNKGEITIEDIKRLCHYNVTRIFGIKSEPTTYIEIDENEEWTIKNENLFTKCGWSPFDGWNVKGRVKSVTIRGKKVFQDGKISVQPGFGEIIKPS